MTAQKYIYKEDCCHHVVFLLNIPNRNSASASPATDFRLSCLSSYLVHFFMYVSFILYVVRHFLSFVHDFTLQRVGTGFCVSQYNDAYLVQLRSLRAL